VNERHIAQHRAARRPLETLTGTFRAVAADAKGASRSVVVVATAGGIAMSTISPASAQTNAHDDATDPGITAETLALDPLAVDKLAETLAELMADEPAADEAPEEVVATAPVVQVSADAVIEVERVGEEGIVPVAVTPRPTPPPPAPVRTAVASRTADRPATGGRWAAAANIGLRYLGVPYVWGGSTPRGFDCSGLVQHVYRQLGVNLPRSSSQMRNSSRTVRIARGEARPGDLIWTPGHIAIYLGNGRQVEATVPGGHVTNSRVWQSNPHFLRVV